MYIRFLIKFLLIFWKLSLSKPYFDRLGDKLTSEYFFFREFTMKKTWDSEQEFKNRWIVSLHPYMDQIYDSSSFKGSM